MRYEIPLRLAQASFPPTHPETKTSVDLSFNILSNAQARSPHVSRIHKKERHQPYCAHTRITGALYKEPHAPQKSPNMPCDKLDISHQPKIVEL